MAECVASFGAAAAVRGVQSEAGGGTRATEGGLDDLRGALFHQHRQQRLHPQLLRQSASATPLLHRPVQRAAAVHTDTICPGTSPLPHYCSHHHLQRLHESLLLTQLRCVFGPSIEPPQSRSSKDGHSRVPIPGMHSGTNHHFRYSWATNMCGGAERRCIGIQQTAPRCHTTMASKPSWLPAPVFGCILTTLRHVQQSFQIRYFLNIHFLFTLPLLICTPSRPSPLNLCNISLAMANLFCFFADAFF